jgi:hypothetical protein
VLDVVNEIYKFISPYLKRSQVYNDLDEHKRMEFSELYGKLEDSLNDVYLPAELIGVLEELRKILLSKDFIDRDMSIGLVRHYA